MHTLQSIIDDRLLVRRTRKSHPVYPAGSASLAINPMTPSILGLLLFHRVQVLLRVEIQLIELLLVHLARRIGK